MKKTRLIFEFEPREGRKIDIAKLISEINIDSTAVDLSDYEVQYLQDSVIDSFRSEFLEYIGKYGLQSYFKRRPILEALVPTTASMTEVKDFFQLYLRELPVTTELLIVDPYIFPKKHDASYPQILFDILNPHLQTLQDLHFITKKDYNKTLSNSIQIHFASASPNLTVKISTTDQWHDRFWISNTRQTGLFVGTSLNGLGKKYSCVEILDSSDVRDIVDHLKKENIL